MVIIIYLLIILSSATQSASTKCFNQRSSQSSVFNAIKALTALIFFALIGIFDFTPHLPTFLFGISYGASLSISMYAGYQALCLGPMALTSMLVSFSVVIPLIWGITLGNESLKSIQYAALILLLIAIVLTHADKIKSKNQKKDGYGAWIAFIAVTFTCNGVSSILQKQHQTLFPEAYSKEFMFFAMLLCSVVFTISAFRKISLKELSTVRGKHFGALSGFTTGISSLLTLMLAGMENASVLFPIISAGTIFASMFCGRFIFKEKLKINHYMALIAGAVAVVLLKL